LETNDFSALRAPLRRDCHNRPFNPKTPAKYDTSIYQIPDFYKGFIMTAAREQWGSRLGFIMAAAGSAIGLGNIWRFPYMAYENGGGAFLIPYFFALLTAGIPILILEFGLGHKMKGSAPLSFARLNRKWEWIGWWQIAISFVISIYYIIIIAWAFNYLWFAVSRSWGTDTIGFFINDFLGLTESPLDGGGIRWAIVGTLVIAWVVNFAVLYSGVKKGIELANKIFMPVLIIVLLILMGRSITLPGAADGISLLFAPDFSRILDADVWVAAYGQIFFSLSIAFGIMIGYASYLPDESDIVNNAFMTGFLNCGFSMLAGITVFGIIGFMMHQAGGALPEKLSGVFLAFVTFPEAVNQLPFLQAAVGILFFVSIVCAGMSSEISISETVICGLMDKFYLPRQKAVIGYCMIAGLISLVFATGSGLLILDIVDHFINNFGIVFAGLLEVILIGWFFKLKILQDHINPISDFSIGRYWRLCILIITPVVLGAMAVQKIRLGLTTPYGGYSTPAILILGWGIALAAAGSGVILSRIAWRIPIELMTHCSPKKT
jgi:NSS family neurotransmitter:Na+ symporter